MLFNSLSFLIFFAAVFLLYFAVIPDRFRWLFLLVASCIFYMAYIPQFILILFFLIAVDYFMGIEIAKAEGSARKKFLIVSIIANLGTLFFFKYFNFFNENAAAIAKLIHWNYSPLLLQIALPLGLSFHVFQSLSYVIEVYKGRQQAERHFGIYALYVMFFPQLVAGPIERPQHMLHQFHEQHDFSAVRVRRGLEIMLWGFFKKLVIADWGGQIVDHVFSNIPGTNSWTVVIAVFLFTYQLYCDFSGYSDIAVGLALVFGYHLTWNFNRPFASRSIAELWRRWHISLSSWLRDYLYTPLAFAWRKAGTWGIYASLLVTFALIGLWHGANWTYVVFGTLQGFYIVCSLAKKKFRRWLLARTGIAKIPWIETSLAIGGTFLFFSFSLVFFRAVSMSQAWQIVEKIADAFVHFLTYAVHWRDVLNYQNLGVGIRVFLLVCTGICALEYVEWLKAKKGTPFIFDDKPKPVRFVWYYALVFSILIAGSFGSQAFIYFKF